MKPQKRRNNDHHKWPIILRKVNVFIRRTNRREVLTFLLFVLIATFFWVVQTWRQDSSSDFKVVFVVVDQPQNKVFTTQVPTHLTVTLTDANMQLMKYGVQHKMDTLKVNFERYADVSGNFRISAAELQSLLREDLESSTTIKRVSPSPIDARFAQAEGRKVAVRLGMKYRVPENYRQRDVVIDPDSVVINAPASLLDTLKYIYTQPSANILLKDTLTEMLPLELAIGVKATPSTVKVMVPVSQYVEKVFERIVVSEKNVPEGYRLVAFPYSVGLSCLVDFDFYRTISENNFQAYIDYDDIREQGDKKHLPIHVSYNGPDEVVTHVKISEQQAEFILEALPDPVENHETKKQKR